MLNLAHHATIFPLSKFRKHEFLQLRRLVHLLVKLYRTLVGPVCGNGDRGHDKHAAFDAMIEGCKTLRHGGFH